MPLIHTMESTLDFEQNKTMYIHIVTLLVNEEIPFRVRDVGSVISDDVEPLHPAHVSPRRLQWPTAVSPVFQEPLLWPAGTQSSF